MHGSIHIDADLRNADWVKKNAPLDTVAELERRADIEYKQRLQSMVEKHASRIATKAGDGD